MNEMSSKESESIADKNNIRDEMSLEDILLLEPSTLECIVFSLIPHEGYSLSNSPSTIDKYV